MRNKYNNHDNLIRFKYIYWVLKKYLKITRQCIDVSIGLEKTKGSANALSRSSLVPTDKTSYATIMCDL